MRRSNKPELKPQKSPLRWLRRVLVAAVFLATASWPFWSGSLGLAQLAPAADDQGAGDADPGPRAAKDVLDQYAKAATPGKFHEMLKPLVGTFAATATYVADPGSPQAADGGRGGLTSQGTSTNTLILGDRFLRQEYVGRLGDREFHGLTLVGYDNVTAGYQSVTCDEASTALFTMDGSASDDGKTITFSGQASDPASGQVKSFRRVLRIEGDDRHTLEMFEPDEGGQMRKTVVVSYQRISDAPASQPGGE